MDFFEHQEEARRNTIRLVLLFVIAVVAVVGAVIGLMALTAAPERLAGEDVVWIAGGTLTLIAIGSIYKIITLRSGGRVVAESLGATLLSSDGLDLEETQLRNVVEEMAIASGIPVPPIYVLRGEPGINAFAAGYSTADGVVAVTDGAIRLLSRDELQGVIAHEFSHILNGDMRLNIRAVGVLHGILMLTVVGRFVLRAAGHASRSNSKGRLGLAVIGLAFIAIGYVGVFAAKVIKAAVSREREYLADASAVQFTRNPDGIAGALKKIGGWREGSTLVTSNAETASHMYFSDGLGRSIGDLLSSHPPLAKRIARLDARWDGTFPDVMVRDGGAGTEDSAAVGFAPPGTHPIDFLAPASSIDLSADRAIILAGSVTPAHLVHTRSVQSYLSGPLVAAAREPFAARVLIYCLLASRDLRHQSRQQALLERSLDATELAEFRLLLPFVERIARSFYLPILDLSMPALRAMSPPQHERFQDTIDGLIAMDQKVFPLEFALRQVLRRHLGSHFADRTSPWNRKRIVDLECRVLLFALAHVGDEDPEIVATAYKVALSRLGLALRPAQRLPDALDWNAVGRALDQLVHLRPAAKRDLIAACAATIERDGKVSLEEAEIFRAIADSLDVPIPPFVDDNPTSGA